MGKRTVKTKKTKKSEMSEEQKEAVIQKARQTVSALEKNLTIYENDLKRNEENLLKMFAVSTVEDALKKAEELSNELPAIQVERDGLIVKLKDYLTENNL